MRIVVTKEHEGQMTVVNLEATLVFLGTKFPSIDLRIIQCELVARGVGKYLNGSICKYVTFALGILNTKIHQELIFPHVSVE